MAPSNALGATPAQHIADLAIAHSLPASDLEAIEVVDGPDPRTGLQIAPPPPVLPPPSVDRARINAILAIAPAARTSADNADAIDILLRLFGRQVP